MSRRSNTVKRVIIADARYESLLVQKFINKVMELALQPVMEAMNKSLETSTSVGGMERALNIVLAHQQERARAAAKAGAH